MKNRFLLLDAVRGFSILWIVVFHLLNDRVSSLPGYAAAFIKAGGLGVPLFFLVSGFSISTAAEKVLKGEVSPSDFLRKRLIRIYLPLLLSLLFAGFIFPALLTAGYWLIAHKGYDFFYHYSFLDWLSLGSLARVFYPVQGDLNRAFLPINGALWFVAVLVQMYLVIYFALIKKRLYYGVLVFVTLCWGISSLFQYKGLPRGLFLPAWVFFASGIALFHLRKSGPQWFRMVVAFAAALFYVCWPSAGTFTAMTWTTLWALYISSDRISNWPPLRLFSFIGVFSYSLYLLHVPLDDLVSMVWLEVSPFPEYLTDVFLIIPTIVLVSWCWSLVFERSDGFNFVRRMFERNKAV